MKQILQSFKDGKTEVAHIPVPKPRSGQLLTQTSASLVSARTERMLVDFGKANWLNKARTDGVLATFFGPRRAITVRAAEGPPTAGCGGRF